MVKGDSTDNQAQSLPHGWSARTWEAFCSERDAGGIRRVLCVHTGFLEDVLLTLPCLEPLIAGLESPEIVFVVSDFAAGALTGHPDLCDVLAVSGPQDGWLRRTLRKELLVHDLRRRRFDLAIDFGGEGRIIARLSGARYVADHPGEAPLSHTRRQNHLRLIRTLGFADPPGHIRLPYNPEHARSIQSFLEGAPRPWIGLHPGSRNLLERWPTARFASLASKIERQTGGTVIVTSGPGEGSLAHEVGVRLKTAAVFGPDALTWTEIQALAAQLDLVIANDSPALHLARGANTPTVGIYGPSMPPDCREDSSHSVVSVALECRTACNARWCSYSEFHACIESIREEDVLRLALERLGEPQHPGEIERAA